MSERISVSSADFIRNIGHWQSEALRHPISITHHGRERLVLAAPEEFRVANAHDAQFAARYAELSTDSEAVLENLEDGFFAFDAALKLKRSNSISEAFVGRGRELMRGMLPSDFLPQPFSTVLIERLHRVMRTRKHEQFEATVEERHLSVRIFPLVDGAAVLFGNVTEQYDQRLRVGVGEALCSAINRHSEVAAIKLETNGRITSVHEAFCARSGYAHGELEGRRLVDLLPAHHRREVTEQLDAALAGEIPVQLEVAFIGRHEQEVSGMLTFAPINIDGIFHGVMAVWVFASVEEHKSSTRAA